MFFAAKEAAERRSRAKDEKARAEGMEKGRKEGREEGRKEARREIAALLKEHNVELPSEVLHRLNGDRDSD